MPKKEKKNYEEFEVEFILQKGNRKELRDAVVKKFLEEKGGYWKEGVKQVTRFRYYVETLSGGGKIFLLRPTYLNKGIDFQVWVKTNEEEKRPSHKGVIEDLLSKQKESSSKTRELMALVRRVWNCEVPDKILKGNSLHFERGWSVELLLKVLRWLFIEQDITYWNYDGREMLWAAIQNELQLEQAND